MKKQIFLILILFSLVIVQADTIFPGVTGRPLIDSLRKYYKSYSNLGYDAARDTMYGKIDKVNDSLECVYSGYKIYMDPTEDPSSWAYSNDINCEHTWPQSLGADTGLPEGDIHHLFPTEVGVNSERGSLPFGDIDDTLTDRWYYDNNIYYSIPTSNIDEYSERLDNVRFEPREKQKGRTARAMFYFYTMYEDYYLAEDSDTSFFNDQKYNLYLWHVNFPADSVEVARTWAIADYQEDKPNPYVLDSTLVRRAFFPELSLEEDNHRFDKDYIEYLSIDYSLNSEIKIKYSINCDFNNINIGIYNILGNNIYKSVNNCTKGENIIKINTNIKQGKYFIIIKNNNQVLAQKTFIIL